MSESVERFIQDGSISQLLDSSVRLSPDRRYAVCDGRVVSIAELREGVDRAAQLLGDGGVSARDRIVVGLPNSIEHIEVIFALFQLGALWVPLNLKLRGAALRHVISDCAATHFMALEGGDLLGEVTAVLGGLPEGQPLTGEQCDDRSVPGIALWPLPKLGRPVKVDGGVCAVIYTSGTTGPAKGVQVTDSMLKASSLGAREVIAPESDDVLYVWEPLCHIGGAQLLLLPLISEASLAIVAGSVHRGFGRRL